ncbi:hypothetical protein FQ085_15160 [Planococcus sp. ANT_H30]|uniref:hypothetical protein n=1 Tax=Planococcus sp. ANT_H30 TaxID=2597347 RepID=UPI0011EE9236|nr:hypothetical protein [Planococcus sp. ANT_H30]KAA0955265.1 hypothetical protein FQ085_15160 [Planococcus sp. ANT_H30]
MKALFAATRGLFAGHRPLFALSTSLFALRPKPRPIYPKPEIPAQSAYALSGDFDEKRRRLGIWKVGCVIDKFVRKSLISLIKTKLIC